MSELINHKELAVSRLATQFRDSTNLITYIRTLLSEADTLEAVFQSLMEERWLDTAVGFQLDILGAIVGQSRVFVDAEIFEYFGFSPNPQAQSFGSVSNPSLGGRFVFIDEPITGFRELNDDEYRLYIRARITKNQTKATPEQIIAMLKFLFSTVLIILAEGVEASYEISIGRKLTLNEKALLISTSLIPKPAGVQVSYVTEFDENDFFAFSGIPGAYGFGSLTNPALGGTFGNLI